MTEQTARERFREWVDGQIKDQASFKIPELVAAAEVEFGEDAGFLRAFLRERMRAAFYDEIQGVVRDARRAIVSIGSTYVNAERITEAVADASRAVWGRWSGHYEHVDGRHLLILDMKDKDIAAAEASRAQQAEHHASRMRFFHELRKGMKRGKTVRDCYTGDALDKLWAEHVETSAAEAVA